MHLGVDLKRCFGEIISGLCRPIRSKMQGRLFFTAAIFGNRIFAPLPCALGLRGSEEVGTT